MPTHQPSSHRTTTALSARLHLVNKQLTNSRFYGSPHDSARKKNSIFKFLDSRLPAAISPCAAQKRSRSHPLCDNTTRVPVRRDPRLRHSRKTQSVPNTAARATHPSLNDQHHLTRPALKAYRHSGFRRLGFRF